MELQWLGIQLMAKGDHSRVESAIGNVVPQANTNQQNLTATVNGANVPFSSAYQNASSTQPQDYQNIMGNYQSMFSDPMNPTMGRAPAVMPTGINGSMVYGNSGNTATDNMMGQVRQNAMSGSGSPGGNVSFNNMGGGWNQYSTPGSPQALLAQAFQKGLTGQQAVDYATQNGAPGIAYYADSGNYGLPNGFYAAPNAQNGGQLDLIQRGGGSGGSSSSSDVSQYGLSGYPAALAKVMSGYSDFAQTGGLSPQDIADLRARAISPIRSVYANAQTDLQRARRLQGGMPNYAAASSQMARNMGQQIGDANQNVNADIVGIRNSNQLAGLGGLSNIGMFGSSTAFQKALAEMQARQGALGGMTSLYGSQPGMMGTTGNQLLGSQQNMIGAQNAGSNNIDAQSKMYNSMVGTPGDFQQALGNIGGAFKLGASLVNPLQSMFGGGGMSIPTNPMGSASYNMYGAGGPTPYGY